MQRVLRPLEKERVIAKRDGQIGPVYLGNLSSHLEVLPWQVKSSGITDRGPEIFLWEDLIFCLNYHLCFFKLQKTLVFLPYIFSGIFRCTTLSQNPICTELCIFQTVYCSSNLCYNIFICFILHVNFKLQKMSHF